MYKGGQGKLQRQKEVSQREVSNFLNQDKGELIMEKPNRVGYRHLSH